MAAIRHPSHTEHGFPLPEIITAVETTKRAVDEADTASRDYPLVAGKIGI